MDVKTELFGKLTFITGSAKNAGKTTFLNYSLSLLRGGGPVAYMTVGVDGEKHCALTAIPKPRIEAFPEDVLVTTDTLAAVSDAGFQALDVFPWRTVLGRTALFKVKRRGFVELAGPETNEQAGRVLDSIAGHGFAQTVLVDGALNRQTQVALHGGSGFVHVARIEPQNLISECEQLKLLVELSRVPQAGAKAAGALFFTGALTQTRAAAIPKNARRIVLEDYTKVFLSSRQWRQFSSGRKICFQSLCRLRFIVPVLKDVSARNFARAAGPAVMKRVLFNPYCEGLK
ncbi:MAG TPA: hypothetical protein PLL10_04095 [Elusimicrobiales bacterium]|nr:hypothetical protein [Elusimicrobiales bacterium]